MINQSTGRSAPAIDLNRGLLIAVITSLFSLLQAATTFEEWQAENFSVADQADENKSGLLADPRGDGFPNLVKYALGFTVDQIPTGAVPNIASLSPFTVDFEHPTGLTDVTYQVQFSSELNASTVWTPAMLSSEDLAGDRQKKTAVDPRSNPGSTSFARLRVFHSSGVVAGPARNLTATSTSPTEVMLTWEGDDLSDGFLIEKSVAGGDFDIVGYVPSGTKSFMVKNLIPGEEVTFRASAVGSSSDNSASNEGSVTPVLGTDGAVLLKFKNTDAEGAITISYEMKLENSTNEVIPLDEITLRYWMDYDNEAPLVAEFYYATTSTSGGANISDSITATPIEAPNPLSGANYMIDFTFAPGLTLPAGTAASPGSVSIQGRMRKDYSGASTLTPGNDFSHLVVASLTTHNKINVLRNGSLIFGVEPGGGVGGADRPIGPAALRAVPMSESTVELTWDDLADNETLFVIERDFLEEPGGFKILTTIDPNSIVFEDGGLLDEAAYRYRIRAVNPDGVSSATNIASATTLDGISPQFIPFAPANFVVTPFSDGRLDLSWSDVSRNEKGFIIERQDGAGGFIEIARVNPGETSYIDYGLNASTDYTYRVTAFNFAGATASSGEIGGTSAPADPEALTDAQVIRFLRQATFGATPDAALITEIKSIGFEAWLDAQLALIPTNHEPASGSWSQAERVEKWWETILTAPDQVHQRLGFALSQIFVVSENDGDLANQARGMARFYDLLLDPPNFEALLNEVTLSPVMGNYLDHNRNQKASPGIRPDENYAREIMQLFTIGLIQLNLDGTPKLDDEGNEIPTYNQRDIEQVARVFTGLTFASLGDFFMNQEDYLQPMRMDPEFHEQGRKDFILLNSDIPDIQPSDNASGDLTLMHAGLAGHSSTAPFICRQLIQRTVTSNPSPAYIERVAQVFVDTSGDLQAVFKAILLDYEARSDDPLDSTIYGKQREPIIRVANLMRILGATAGRPPGVMTGPTSFNIGDLTERIQQSPLKAPSVFNFFEPDFSLPGPITLAELASPEFQTTQSSTIIESANLFNDIIFGGFSDAVLVFTRYSNLAGDPDQLLDQLSTDLLDGRMPPAMRLVIKNHLAGVSGDEMKAKTALYLVVSSSEFNIEQ